MSLRRTLLAALAASLLCALAGSTSAHATISLPDVLRPVAKNPADALASLPIEGFEYDPARKCRRTPMPGAVALVQWLQRNAKGVNWGINRCELWGKGSASLHAEGRAIDWHLDAAVPAQRREAIRLITLFLAPDRNGEPAALARRMGVQELIFDCKAWFGGEAALRDYSYCVGKHGRRRKGIDRTAAHMDHIHIGMNLAGAKQRTSYWTRGR